MVDLVDMYQISTSYLVASVSRSIFLGIVHAGREGQSGADSRGSYIYHMCMFTATLGRRRELILRDYVTHVHIFLACETAT